MFVAVAAVIIVIVIVIIVVPTVRVNDVHLSIYRKLVNLKRAKQVFGH